MLRKLLLLSRAYLNNACVNSAGHVDEVGFAGWLDRILGMRFMVVIICKPSISERKSCHIHNKNDVDDHVLTIEQALKDCEKLTKCIAERLKIF